MNQADIAVAVYDSHLQAEDAVVLGHDGLGDVQGAQRLAPGVGFGHRNHRWLDDVHVALLALQAVDQLLAQRALAGAALADHGDELVVHDCDLDRCTEIRANIFNFRLHRRPEIYTALTATDPA